MRNNICPACGAEDVKHDGGKWYKCRDCGFEFDYDDEEFEEIRHKISAILMDTDEEHPMECNAIVGENIACGLSSLELPHIDKCYQMPGEGIMYFHMEDTIPDTWAEFDDFSLEDARSILNALQEND